MSPILARILGQPGPPVRPVGIETVTTTVRSPNARVRREDADNSPRRYYGVVNDVSPVALRPWLTRPGWGGCGWRAKISSTFYAPFGPVLFSFRGKWKTRAYAGRWESRTGAAYGPANADVYRNRGPDVRRVAAAHDGKAPTGHAGHYHDDRASVPSPGVAKSCRKGFTYGVKRSKNRPYGDDERLIVRRR